MIYETVLWAKQKKMISLLDQFSDSFFLVWWTAIALQIWHRFSVDFDLFVPNTEVLPREKIDRILRKSPFSWQVLIDTQYHYEILIHDVKITWYAYPYRLSAWLESLSALRMPPLITLAVMKAHAIQRRAKWKDYVDVALLNATISLESVLEEAQHQFWWAFSSKLFAAQLLFTDDIDFSEEVERLPWKEIQQSEIFSILEEMSKKITEIEV